MAPKVAEGYFQVVLEHGFIVSCILLMASFLPKKLGFTKY
jgi:hypothetical protein